MSLILERSSTPSAGVAAVGNRSAQDWIRFVAATGIMSIGEIPRSLAIAVAASQDGLMPTASIGLTTQESKITAYGRFEDWYWKPNYVTAESATFAAEQIRKSDLKTEFTWISRAKLLESKGRIEAALDTVYDQLDDLLLDRKYRHVDKFLSLFSPQEFSANLILSVITVTRPYRQELPHRSDVCRLSRVALLSLGKDPEALLTRFDV